MKSTTAQRVWNILVAFLFTFNMLFGTVPPAAAAPSAEAPSAPPAVEPQANGGEVPSALAMPAELQVFSVGDVNAAEPQSGGLKTVLADSGLPPVNDGCMGETSGFGSGLNCTANDVAIASVSSLTILDDGCLYPGDTVTFSAKYQVTTSATERYDVGLYFATDGDPNLDGAKTGSCTIATLPYAPDPPWLNLDSAQPTDVCGDISKDGVHNTLSPVYTFTATCVDPDGNGKMNFPSCTSWRVSGSNGTCTTPTDAFPSEKSKCKCDAGFEVPIKVPGQIIVDKVTSPSGDLTNFDFTLTGTPTGGSAITPVNFSLADASDPYKSASLDAGTYSVVETANANYTTTVTCSDGSPANAINLSFGETVTCTFTNTRNTGKLEVKKDVVPDDTSTNWNFDITGPSTSTCAITGDGTCGNKTVDTGSYSITETAGSGTTLGDYATSYSCTVNGGAGPAGTGTAITGLTINKSDVVVCTFTNSKSPGTLTVNKVLLPSSDPGKFNLQIDGVTKAPDVGDGGTTGAVSVGSGSHTVGETAGTSTDLSNYVTTIGGDCDSSGNVTVGPNQSKTCTITNARKGNIVIKKLTDPAGAAGDFTFSGAVSGTIQDGGTLTASNLDPGAYNVTETSLAADFALESITCDDSNSTGDVATKKVSITLDAGETVTCTFTNKKLNPNLAVTKTADAASVTAGDAVGFKISVKNNGLGTAYNVTLSDPLPAIPGVTWTIASQPSGDPCTLTGASLSCSFGNLAPDASTGEIHITGTTAGNSCGTWNNTATAQADNNAPVTGSASILVDCATIKIAKTGNGPINAGDNLSYAITVTNDNSGTAHNVTVNDPLPTTAGLGAWSLSGTDAGACSIAAGALTCTFGDMAGHTSKTVTLTTTTTAASCGDVDNTASVTSSNDGSDESSATVKVQCPNLSVTKTADASPVNAGDPVGFTITVHNAGPGVAKSVTLTDTLPAGLTWTVPSGCTLSGQDMSCDLGNLASGADAIVHVTATSSPATCGEYTNTATATPTNGSAATSAPAVLTVNCADVTVAKSGNGPVSAGDTATFTITVSVTGAGTLSNVTLNDPLPAGVTWALDPAVDGCAITETGGVQALACSWTTLTAPQTITIDVSGTTDQADCAAPLSNTATVAAANETDTTKDTASASITVDCATIQVAKTTSTPTVSAGDPISYTITVTNPGTGIARNVTVTDTLPTNAGLNWSYPASCSVSAGVLTCNLGDIAGGGSKSVTLTSPTTAATCGTVSNTASVSTTNDGSGTSDTINITVQCPTLSVTKTPDAASVSAGDTIGYTITVTNAGPGEAKGVMITDSLPGGLAWSVDAGGTTATGCSVTAGTLTCGPDTLAKEGSVSVHVTAPSTPAVCGTLTNTATATPSNGEAATSPAAGITILCPDLTVTKTGNGPISAGDTATYTITVKNIGLGEARGVTLTDNLPGGLTWTIDTVNTTATGCTVTGSTLTCGPDTIAAGASVKVTVSAVTTKDNCGTLTNSASTAATNEANTSNNNSGDVDIEVDCATIQIEKTTTTPTVSAGDPINYTIKVTNPGTGTAYNVVVTDSLPGGLTWTIDTVNSDTGCSISGSVLTCDFGTILSGGSKKVTITATTTAENCGTLTNTASVTTSNDGAATTPAVDITVQCPHLSVTKLADSSEVSAGEAVTFTITVSNAGPGEAKGVMITDNLPGGLAWTVVAANTNASGCSISGAGVLTCGPDTIASGGSIFVQVTAPSTPAACGPLSNTATATPINGDAATSQPAIITVLCPDLTVTKTGNSPISAGDTATYTITVNNIGLGEAKGVTITDTLPIGLTWTIDTANTTASGCVVTSGTLTCGPDILAAGASIKVTVSAVTTKANCGTLTNSATAAAENESNTSNNSSSDVDIEVDCTTIQITKTADAKTVNAGETIGFTIEVTNPGPATAYGVTLTDTLPANGGLSWLVGGPDAGDFCEVTGGVLTCIFGTMAPHTTRSVHISSPTTSATCGTVENSAHVSTTNDGSGDASESITVNCPNLTVEKTGNGTINSNDTAIYTITVTNTGPGAAADVTVSDALLASINWSVDNGNCSIDESKLLTCNFGTLPAGNHITFHVSGTVTPGICGPLENLVTVAATNEADTSNNSATGTVTVDCASISITKTAASPINAGDTLTYTITVTNNGTGTAYGVTVTDTLPTTAGLGPWTVTPGDPTCTITAGVLTCNLGDMLKGASQVITLSSPTTYASCGTISNEASVSTTNDGNNTASKNVEVQCPALTVTKTPDAAVVSAGDAIGFTITVKNTGDGIARNVSLSDSLPSGTGINWTIASADPTCTLTGTALSCTFGDLAKNESKTVHVTSPTTKDSCATYNNTATASADNQPSVNSPEASITVQCTAIQITKTADNTPVSAGDTIGFTITVTNPGPATAYGVTVSDLLTSSSLGTNWSISSPVEGCSITANPFNTLSCNFGTMAANTSKSVHISSPTTAASCPAISNRAYVTTTNDGGDDDAATIVVFCPDITITKTPDAASVSAGEAIGFTITVTNGSLGKAYGVSLSDTLPTNGGLDWAVLPSQAGCGITGGVLSCNVGTLGPNGTFSVHISSPTTAETCGTVSNTATVTATNEKPNQTNNSVTASITVDCPALTVTKTADAASVNAGDGIGFTITVSNAGPGVARSVVLTDTLPSGSGINWDIDSGTGMALCAIDTGILTCGYGNMIGGSSYTIHVISPTDSTSCGTYDNTAKATASNQADVTASASITVNCATIAITKTTDTPSVNAGDPISYKIVVTNNGTGTAHGVTVTDPLPSKAGLVWTATPGEPTCTITAGNLTCDLGDLAAGASQTITLTSPTTYTSCDTLSNTATVTTSNDGTATSQPATITVNCPAITVTKTADAATVNAGDPIGFTITVTNTGDGVAKNVQLADTLPTGGDIQWSIASADPTCTYTEPNLTCSFGNLAKGESKTVHLTSPTTANSCATYDNIALVTADNYPAVTSQRASITVQCAAIHITKKADASAVSTGDTIGFTIEVTNPGPGTAYGVTITDTLPANPGLAWTIDPAKAECSITGGVLTCNVGTLAANTSFLVHISSPTTQATCGGTVSNTAHVSTTNDGSGEASDSITVNCANITILKGPESSTVNAGDDIAYAITVKNQGAGTAKDVVITDTLPSNPGLAWQLGLTSNTPGVVNLDCHISVTSPQVLTCTADALPAGGEIVIQVISPTTLATACQTINNTASVTTSNDGQATTPVSPITVSCANITIAKVPLHATVSAGDPIAYDITVTNNGLSAASNVVITDNLPDKPGLQWTIDSITPVNVSGSCNLNLIPPQKLTCTFNQLAAGQSATVRVSSPTTYATCGMVSNTASVTTTNDGEATTEPATITVNCPALEVVKTPDTQTVSAGDPLSFTITVTNNGAGTAKNVTLTDPLPLGVSWSVNNSGCGVDVNGVLTCNFGNLGPGESTYVTVTGNSTTGLCGTFDNTGTIHLDNGPDVTSNTVSATVNCADVTVTKAAVNGTINSGDTAAFKIVVTNIGAGTAYGVTLNDTLPPGEDWAMDPAVTGCSFTDNVLSCSWASLAAGASIEITVKAVTDVGFCFTIDNTVSVAATNETNAANNSASATITVNCADVSVTKTGNGPINATDTAVFTITVTNLGPGRARWVSVTDPLPTGINWTIDPAVTGCSINAGELSCFFDSVEKDTPIIITVSGKTSVNNCTTLNNTVTVHAANEGNTSVDNNTAKAAIIVNCADVTVLKEAVNSPINAGDTAAFKITVSNIGAGTAYNVTLDDQLPVGAWAIAPAVTGCSISPSNLLSCSWPTLAAGANLVINLSRASTADDCPTIVNSVTVAASNEANTDNNTGGAVITVNCPDVAVTKAAVTGTINAGDMAAFKIVVANIGLGTAKNVTLNDTLPAGITWTIDPAVTGCAITGNTLACSWATLAATASVTITVSGMAPPAVCGTLTNTATVAASNEFNIDNNSSTAAITVNCADVTVAKTAAASTINAGDTAAFKIIVSNTGAGRAYNITLNDTLPAGITWTIDPAVTGCAITGNTLSCAWDNLAAGTSVEINVSGMAPPAVCGTLTNTATVAATTEANTDNNSSTAAITVNCADVKITKEAVDSTIRTGETAAFKIIVSNIGAGTAYNVTLTDTLPAGITWTIDPAVTGCAITGSVLSCAWNNLAAGASLEINVSGTAVAGVCNDLVNTATVTASNEANTANNSATATITVNCAQNLTITKTADATFKRTFNWSITKTVDRTYVRAVTCGVDFHYTVTVKETGFVESNWLVTGKITITNPNGAAVPITGLSDTVNNGGTCTITGPDNVQSVPADGQVVLDYQCTYPATGPTSLTGTNTTTVTWGADLGAPDTSATATADFTFVPTEVNKIITITDTFNGHTTTLGTVTAVTTTPYTTKVFTYEHNVPVPHDASYKVSGVTTSGRVSIASSTCPYSTTSAAVDVKGSAPSKTVPVGKPLGPDYRKPLYTFKPQCTSSCTPVLPKNVCENYYNTAKIVETGQRASVKVTVCGPMSTDAKTIGYWQNKNGQSLILYAGSVSGVCKLTPWLRQFAPFQDLNYRSSCGTVATYVLNKIKAATASGASMNAMLKAQMLATALDVYFSDPALGGNKLGAPAPIGSVLVDLTYIKAGSRYLNVSKAFGGATKMTVMQMLKYAASKSNVGGSVWYSNVKTTQELAKDAFDAINNQWVFAP